MEIKHVIKYLHKLRNDRKNLDIEAKKIDDKIARIMSMDCVQSYKKQKIAEIKHKQGVLQSAKRKELYQSDIIHDDFIKGLGIKIDRKSGISLGTKDRIGLKGFMVGTDKKLVYYDTYDLQSAIGLYNRDYPNNPHTIAYKNA